MLLLDKAVGISSNRALQVAKRLFRAKKAGHAGTLDPLASGLLPVFLGEATRFSGFLLAADKRYVAKISLGTTTATGDAEGDVLVRRPVAVNKEDLASVIDRFLGRQMQVPPMYSAIKRDGTPLYVLARRGETVERVPRQIEIHSLVVHSFNQDVITLEVACSKGTYIRTLAEDIGSALGCGAHLSGLRRTAAGPLKLAGAISLEALGAIEECQRDAQLRPADKILGHLPSIELDDPHAVRFCHGQELDWQGIASGTIHRVYAPGARFLGLGEALDDNRLRPKRLLGDTKTGVPSS